MDECVKSILDIMHHQAEQNDWYGYEAVNFDKAKRQVKDLLKGLKSTVYVMTLTTYEIWIDSCELPHTFVNTKVIGVKTSKIEAYKMALRTEYESNLNLIKNLSDDTKGYFGFDEKDIEKDLEKYKKLYESLETLDDLKKLDNFTKQWRKVQVGVMSFFNSRTDEDKPGCIAKVEQCVIDA